MDITGLNRLLAPIWARVQLTVGRFVVAGVDDTPALRTLQLSGLADETLEGAELFQHYGFSSRPHPGAEAVGAAVGGLRDHVVVIATADRRYTVKLEAGECGLFDDLGQRVHLTRTGVEVETPGNVSVTAGGTVEVDATGTVRVVTDGDLELEATTVRIEGDVELTGNLELTGDLDVIGNSVLTGQVDLGGVGGDPVARLGDSVQTSPPEIEEGSATVRAVA